MFDRIDFQRIFTATAGAALLSATCVFGAIGPARAATPAAVASPLTVADWQHEVEARIADTLATPSDVLRDGSSRHAVVNVRFDALGGFDGAAIAQSSGSRTVDREALRTARAIAYPVLPAGLRGRPQTVAMKLSYGLSADALARGTASVTRTARKAAPIETASLPAK